MCGCEVDAPFCDSGQENDGNNNNFCPWIIAGK